MGVEQVRFEVFVHTRGTALVRMAALMCGDGDLAQDLVQDALFRASRRWSRIDDPDAYIRTAISRGAIDRWRRTRREILVSQIPDTAAASPAGSDDDLLHALRRLPARQRVALVLRYLDDLSLTSTAEAMGCTEGTVKTHCHRGLAALRAVLESEVSRGG